MAGKVGLKDAEYSALESGVKQCHDDSLSQIETAIQKLRRLNSKGGGLYAKALTPKVDAVVKQLNSIKSSMLQEKKEKMSTLSYNDGKKFFTRI